MSQPLPEQREEWPQAVVENGGWLVESRLRASLPSQAFVHPKLIWDWEKAKLITNPGLSSQLILIYYAHQNRHHSQVAHCLVI